VTRRKDTSPRSHGQINLSQAVSNYGVGAVCELRSFFEAKAKLNSVMIAGQDWWVTKDLKRISEPTLAKSLNVKYLVEPPLQDDDEGSWNQIPAARFPRWLVCSKCERLGMVGREFSDLNMTQPECNDSKCKGKGVPARLVRACFHQAKDGDNTAPTGHIDDFPWVWWAFSLPKREACSSPKLYLISTGKSSSLAGLRVECRCPECRGLVGRTLEDVFGQIAYTSCTGRRPWLNDEDPIQCNRQMRVLLRGASNIYFAVTPSAISIPPFSASLVRRIDEECRLVVDSVGKLPMETLVSMVTNFIPYITKSYSEDQIAHALLVLANPEAVQVVKSDQEQRLNERVALRQGMPEESIGKSEFVAEPTSKSELSDSSILDDKVEHLVRVTRLREVRVLRGFTRVVPPPSGDLYTTPCAPIARKAVNWLPAFEVRGEGIYIELSNDKVGRWEALDSVKKRTRLMHYNQQEARRINGLPPLIDSELPSSRLIMVHTLAHLLMKQLSLECGYSNASLRERLYVIDHQQAEEMRSSESAGFLIYTSTSDADGTLGGLVRQGTTHRLEQLLKSSIESAGWCSSDPLCIESTGQGADARNLAACHACCLLSETSCETGNRDLDRGFLIGTDKNPELGFFRELISLEENSHG
jgi:hypothetical protein